MKTLDRTAEFHIQLRDLFERYANWSFRPGEVVKKNIHIPQYNLSAQVIHKVSQAVKKSLKDEEKAIELADALWRDPYYEMRIMAINILSNLPADPADNLHRKIVEWAQETKETHILQNLFDVGSKQLRNQHPGIWLAMIEEWLEKGDDQVLLGLSAIRSSINDPDFKQIPNIYKIITKPLLRIPKGFYSLMLEIVMDMISRLPSETSFFLQQIILRDPSPETVRIIRRVIPSFPKPFQNALRSTIMEFGEPKE